MTHSKSKHYNPEEPNEDLTAHTATQRDEVGLVRSIVVKVFGIFSLSLLSLHSHRLVHRQNERNVSGIFNAVMAHQRIGY